MRTTVQHSVFLINKPGVLAQVLEAIAEAKVNILALTIVDAQEHGVLRVVGDNPERLGKVLGQLNLPVHETFVLIVELANRPGALVGVVSRLAKEHVNIEYAYVTAGAPGGKTTGILKVDNLLKAGKLLEAARGGDRSPAGPWPRRTGRASGAIPGGARQCSCKDPRMVETSCVGMPAPGLVATSIR